MNLKEALKEKLSKAELQKFIRSFDVVGDIAIIIIPPELEEKESLIGETILSLHKNIQVVAKRAGVYDGEFRTIPLTIIAGVNRKETEHKEYGVRFVLNPEKVYFSVRSASERKRIAQLVQTGEEVLVLFSGIGAFPLVIAGNSSAGRIVGIEKNPIAHEYAVRNLGRNKKITNVIFYEGDVVNQLPGLDQPFDRVLMPLPKSAFLFLDESLAMVKSGGWLHFYAFQQRDDFAETVELLEAACIRNNRRLVDSKVVICGHCGTRLFRICIDAKIE